MIKYEVLQNAEYWFTTRMYTKLIKSRRVENERGPPCRFPWDWEIKMSLSLLILSVGSYRPGHPWGASWIAATYLNKTLYRAAIHPPLRISPTTLSYQINKLSCTECTALQGRLRCLTNSPACPLCNWYFHSPGYCHFVFLRLEYQWPFTHLNEIASVRYTLYL